MNIHICIKVSRSSKGYFWVIFFCVFTIISVINSRQKLISSIVLKKTETTCSPFDETN